jgi:hypothetical protein
VLLKGEMTSIVFGNLPFPGQGGDRVVSKAVTAAISALFRQVEKLEAVVKAEPVAKLLQGSVDGFDFVGQGLLMYSGLRVHSMEFYVQSVSIDFGAIFKGQVTLKQPTQATMRIVLTEEDLTASFNTPFLVEKLKTMQFQGETLHFQDTDFDIQDDGLVHLQSQVTLGNGNSPTPVGFTAQLQVKERHKLEFVNISQEHPESSELGAAIVEQLNALLDFDRFALDGMQLRVDQLRLRNDQMTLYGVAKITNFPQRSTKAT